MLKNFIAIGHSGMPYLHSKAFQNAANHFRCVIGVRAVGKCATSLLLEGYATKSFHNKAKSCSWGPMAGFVVSDPRLSKNRDIHQQRMALHDAFHHGASETPLYISENRRLELEQMPLGMILKSDHGDEKRYVAKNTEGKSFQFILKKTCDIKKSHHNQLWAIFYGQHEKPLYTSPHFSSHVIRSDHHSPVMAIVDPLCPKQKRNTHLAATVCDYDLWGIFPIREQYAKQTLDKRSVPNSERQQQYKELYEKYLDPDQGNTTLRVRQIQSALNHHISANGYRSGNVVHHGDEAGRPFIKKIDLPCLFFVPDEPAYYIETVSDLLSFIHELKFKYMLTLNPGWFSELHIDSSQHGYYEC